MKYAIELYFDAQTEGELTALAKQIAHEGISTRFLEWKTRPHLTLACFNDVDEAACAEKLRAFASGHGKLPAYLGSVGMFTDSRTIFVSPVMTSAMYQFQRELHECMQGFDTKGWEWYLPERWVPHCTVALTRDDSEEAFYRAGDLMMRKFHKIAGQFSSIGLVRVTCPVEEIETAELGGQEG